MKSNKCVLSTMLGMVAVLTSTGLVYAATLNVDTITDDVAKTACDDATENDCSLRGALIAANARPVTENTIFNVPAGTYILTQVNRCDYISNQGISQFVNTSALCFAGNLTLVGAGATEVIIDGNASDRVMLVGNNGPVTIRGVTIRNGRASGGAGGLNFGSFTLIESVVTANDAATGGGGGMYNYGILTVQRSVIDGNMAGGSNDGGGIFNYVQSTLVVTDSTISNNRSSSNAGGVMNFAGTVVITNSTVSNNETERSLGGGVGNFGGNFIGKMTVTNSTISGNTSGSGGGGIYNHFLTETHLNNVTIANNTGSIGGGIYNIDDDMTLRNTLIAGNTATNNSAPDCSGFAPRDTDLISQGYNLIQNPDGCDLSGDLTGNILGQNPQLGLLVDNGGLTKTHALASNSPALDAGNPAAPGSGGNACTAVDQRGAPRPQGTRCDIGAFEGSEEFVLTKISPSIGGNSGEVLAFISGSALVNGSTVTLRRSGQPDIIGNPVHVDVGGSALGVTFALAGRAIGSWDVVVINPNGVSQTLAGGFTIAAGGAPQLWVDVVGPTFIRVTRPARFFIYYGNRGNVDAIGVPLLLTVFPKNIAVHLHFPIAPPPAQTGQVPTDWSQVAVAAAEQQSTYIPLVLPVVPAGFTGVLEVTLTAATLGNFEVRFGIGDPYLQPEVRSIVVDALTEGAITHARDALGVEIPPALGPQLKQYVTTQLQSVADHGRHVLIESVGTASEVYSLSQLLIDVARFGAAQVGTLAAASPEFRRADALAHGSPLLSLPVEPSHMGGSLQTWLFDLRSLESGSEGRDFQTSSVPTDAPMTRWSATVSRWIATAFSTLFLPNPAHAQGTFPPPVDCTGLHKQGGVLVPGQSLGGGGAQTGRCQCNGPHCGGNGGGSVGSRDPNDKVGSRGAGTAQYLVGAEPLRYSILFENVETATAPAQEVIITDQLDGSKVDFDTFSLGAISFGDKTVVPPPGLSQYSTSVDLRPAQDLLVLLRAGLDKTTGVVTWRLTSVDPETLQFPEDPLAGFLPPNVNPPEGDGSVLFTVQPKVVGTPICNQARIVFDTNDPIDTPQWCNTIDATPPSSAVQSLSATQATPDFPVQWAGSDQGAGISGYSLYVSTNGGPFAPWLENTTNLSAVFVGQPGRTYAFYSIARDLVGNVEAAPLQPDTTTRVAGVGGELCGNCVDDDSDGKTDWLDDDCERTVGLTVKKGGLNAGKPAAGDEKITLSASFDPAAIDPPTDGVTLSFVLPGTGAEVPDVVLACVQIPPGAAGWKTNKTGTQWTFKDTKGGPLGDPNSKDAVVIKYNVKKQRYDLTGAIAEAEVGALVGGEVSTQVSVGDQGGEQRQAWRLKGKGKQLVTP